MKMMQTDSPSPSIPERSGASAELAALIDRARRADGQPPFSDQALVDLRTGAKELLTLDRSAAVFSPTEAEFVVDPEARGRGLGTALLEALLSRGTPDLRIWAHGDHPAARALARSHGLAPVRELLQLRAPVPVDPPSARPATPPLVIDTFRPGIDDGPWLRLNARAFAFHPEQGSVTQSDLDELKKEAWFDPADFLVLRDGRDPVGYCWLKVEDGVGEFYVVGVDPDRQGEGLGRRLMDAGFARLAARGIPTAALYVEADNVPAVNLYRSLGFATHSVDIQYARA
jgi:mycothiol synthase